MTHKEVRFGIVGCGMISEVQADALSRINGARVVAFCDEIAAAAAARADRFGGRVYTRVQDLATDPEIDAVSICTPSGLHMEAAITAADAGKHVMVEKPIEITTARATAIVNACRKNGVKLGAIFPRRFLDSSQLVKQAVATGRFGTTVLASAYIKWYRDQEYYSASHWRGTFAYDGGGALMNQGVHGIDLLQWLMGGVANVTAFSATRAHTGIEVEDVAVAALRFNSGALGVIEGTTGAWPGEKLRIEISGDAGSVALEDEAIKTWQFMRETLEDDEIRRRFAGSGKTSSGGATNARAIDSEGHRLQLEDFVHAIRENRKPRVDGSEGRAAVAVINAIYASAREGRQITVEEF
jgi:predicted dehydrogenase